MHAISFNIIYFIFKARLIAPVTNILALQRAKKKVEELKAEKKFAFTPAQTSKAGSRVAHKATVKTARVEPVRFFNAIQIRICMYVCKFSVLVFKEKQSKPPVLEANSTKISFNIRMQYYDMMVKHSLAIYPNSVDAWERVRLSHHIKSTLTMLYMLCRLKPKN